MRVIVVGAGVVGLTTAVSLLEAGCDVRVVADATVEATTSYIAAGVWFPTHAGPPGKVAVWGRRTLEVLAGQARESVPGVVMRESLALYRQPPGRPDWAAAVGRIREAVTAELPAGYAYGLRFAVPQAEMPVYLPWLMRQVRDRGGEIVPQHVADLAELSDAGVAALVNCPGLAARDLVGDQSVYPVRGQLVRVTNPGITLSVRDEFHPAGRAYVHPRTSDCILGGTLEEHRWDTEPDQGTAEAIIARCREILPAIADAKVIEHLAGLRPGRPEVRLEESTLERGSPRLVHNYGHGGSGVTLSWGCAENVVSILANATALPGVLLSVGRDPVTTANGWARFSRRNGAHMSRVGIIIPLVVMCGLLVSACSPGSSAAPRRTSPVRVTTETVRIDRYTQIFDTALPADPAQASVVQGFRTAMILWDKSSETLKLVSPVTAYVTGSALRGLKRSLAGAGMVSGKVIPGGTDRFFKTHVTVISGTSATIATCDDGSKFEEVNPTTGVPDPAFSPPANQRYIFETWQMIRLGGHWAISVVSPVTLPDSRAEPCQPLRGLPCAAGAHSSCSCSSSSWRWTAV